MSDTHRVVVKFDLDGDALGVRTHGHVENDLAAVVLWALQQTGYHLGDVQGLRVKVRDAS